MTSLEVLFCKEVSRIKFQLTSRISWFLSPDKPQNRAKIMNDVKNLYNLRSKIVHGGNYSVNKIGQHEMKLITLIRKVFQNPIISFIPIPSLLSMPDLLQHVYKN